MSENIIERRPHVAPLIQNGLDALMDLPLRVHAELGRTQMRIEEFLRLEPSSVVELPVSEGEYIGIFVNGKLIARGEVIVLEGTMAIRIAEVVDQGVI